MPTIYRAMKRGDDGLPLVQASARGLGVRLPPSLDADIDLDENGMVLLNGRGMSVASHWRNLPRHRIPMRLRDDENGALGSNTSFCWKFGSGAFQPGAVSDRLLLIMKPHDQDRGNVVPSEAVSVQQFQVDLAATRDRWTVDES